MNLLKYKTLESFKTYLNKLDSYQLLIEARKSVSIDDKIFDTLNYYRSIILLNYISNEKDYKIDSFHVILKDIHNIGYEMIEKYNMLKDYEELDMTYSEDNDETNKEVSIETYKELKYKDNNLERLHNLAIDLIKKSSLFLYYVFDEKDYNVEIPNLPSSIISSIIGYKDKDKCNTFSLNTNLTKSLRLSLRLF